MGNSGKGSMKYFRYGFIFLALTFFFTMFVASSTRNVYLSDDGGKSRFGIFADILRTAAEIPSNINRVFFKTPEFFVQNQHGEDGFSFENGIDTSSLPNFLISFKEESFQQKFVLYQGSSGEILKSWAPNNKELYELGYNEDNPWKPPFGSDLYFMHAYMSGDSTLFFNSQLTSLFAKIDEKSNLLWLKNDRIYHHSIEPDLNGNLLVCTRPFESGKYAILPGRHEEYKTALLDDHITKLDQKSGDILFDKSVIQILIENGFEDLLVQKGQVISDPIHLNDIQPAISDTEFWKKGDLLVSCRNINTIFLYRPSTDKIIWLKQGPWSNQHDVDFHKDNSVVVFGNDVIREESVIDRRLTNSSLSFNEKRPHNEVYIFNVGNDSISRPFHDLMKSENIGTITSGRSEILKNGDVFIEETNQGRIVIGDSTTKKIEYVKRLDEDNISSLFWSRIVN